MELKNTMDRRRFVKMFTLGASFGCVAASGVGRILAEIVPTAKADGGLLNLKVSSFPVLGAENGRLRLGLNGISTSVSNPRPTGAFYPFYVTRGPDIGGQKVFHAFSSRCTHQDTVVGVSTATPGQLRCPNHSSRYNIDGSVLPGQRARFDLETYAVDYDGDDTLKITIPGLGYAVDGSGIQTGVGDRLEIEFRAQRNVNYEAVSRSDLSGGWETTSFATTPDGAADRTRFTGGGLFSKIYVDRTEATKFVAVRALVDEV